ncbi:hypothetical protein HQ576_09055 [bacterium]|nr:hypothetical protein [bacterium]
MLLPICRCTLVGALQLAIVVRVAAVAQGAGPESQPQPHLRVVRRFADCVLEHGRDRYGKRKTPLFADGLHAKTLEPARWKKGGETWVLCNFASQQPLLRLLDGLTAVTGEPRYRQAAEEAARHVLEHLRTPNGLLHWGGHMAWDLLDDKPVWQYALCHELKNHQPYYRLLWRVNPTATRRLIEAIWATHVVDWSLLDYNRHASGRKKAKPPWDHLFRDETEVPFPAKGGNLSFCNVTPPLMHSGVMLAILGKDSNALRWTRRLVRRWQQARHPATGLCGGQLSYRKEDRARQALGHVHPRINEARIVASYHQISRYHMLPLAQLQAAEALAGAGGASAEVGREFLQWASEDLRTYGRRCCDPATGAFPAVMTDGTPIQWQDARTGYYTPESFAPRKPDGFLFWAYALAYRLTRNEDHWRMARQLAERLGLGDIGTPGDGQRSISHPTRASDWRLLYALLELHQATGRQALLRLAASVGANAGRQQAPTGLFPRSGRDYARTGDELPLALLHLAAAMAGTRDRLPPAIFDRRFFHCVHDGPLEPRQRKRADPRTYDGYVFYGDR